MGVFQERTKGQLGDEQQLLRGRTLFGFYAPFLSTEDERTVLQSLLGDGTGAWEKLGIKRAGINRINPLKLCPDCVREQIAAVGYAYWKTEQQLPTAYVCKTHADWLQLVVVPQRRGALQAFHAPDDPHELINLLQPDTTKDEKKRMLRLGDWGDYIFGSRGLRLTETTLRHCYLHQAKVRGWLTFEGTVRMQQLRDAFVKEHQVILRHFDKELFGNLMGINGGFLAYLVRQLPSRRHPIKHLLLINFLFEQEAELIEVTEKVQAAYADGGEPAIKKLLCDARERLYHFVAVEGQSMNRAAAAVGIPVSRAAKYLNKRGVEQRERRPRIVGTNKERQLLEMLAAGQDRKKITQALGLGVAFIKDYLASKPQLKEEWEKKYHSQQLSRHRERLLAVLEENPGVPIKSIRRIPGNGFQWLYNHDREWLRLILPAIWKQRSP
jgi:transposase